MKIKGMMRLFQAWIFLYFTVWIGLVADVECADTISLEMARELEQRAMSMPQGEERQKLLWKSIEANPRSTQANLQLGLEWSTTPSNPMFQYQGFLLLEKVLDPFKTDNPFPLHSMQTFVLANLCGRWRWSRSENDPARHFFELALRSKPNDVCTMLQLASLLDPFPESIEAADKSMELYHRGMDELIEKIEQSPDGLLHIDPMVVKSVPGALPDPYNHCYNGLFYHSFYYRADAADSTRKHYRVAAAVWPELVYTSPRLLEEDGKTLRPIPSPKPCVNRKLRLGVASGHASPGSSVMLDFGGVLRRLDRDIFDIMYIYINSVNRETDSLFMDPRDKFMLVDHRNNGHDFMLEAHKEIEALDLDILYYLDLTMGTHNHRMGMARLAPVQAVSHGHPITSGIPAIDYYISWAAAELPYEQAQKHYTEKLLLLPADKMHQYYEGRYSSDGITTSDGLPYAHLVDKGRSTFPDINPNGNWYLCMQKPFKLHPEFDELVAGILRSDPNGRVLLHKEDQEYNQRIFTRRLEKAGCDMERVHFVPVQPHFMLSALYRLSDVILDSYPAGGCTTTREVLELGKAVVTLPARYLGARWSLAYYNIMGDEKLNSMVIASDPDEYIRLAVKLGTDKEAREEVERRIKRSSPKLFRRMEPVEEWTKMLLDIAPVRISSVEGSGCSDEPDGSHPEL